MEILCKAPSLPLYFWYKTELMSDEGDSLSPLELTAVAPGFLSLDELIDETPATTLLEWS